MKIIDELNEQIQKTEEELNWRKGYSSDKSASEIDAFRIKQNQKVIMEALVIMFKNKSVELE